MHKNKDRLLALKRELSQRISEIDNDLHSRHASAKFSEQVVERQNDDVLLNLKNEAQVELEQINHALQKIDNNVYEQCDKCHKPIGDKRLAALPYATLCSHCAS
ncbi:TraR/DksA family transcriptional regulator [Alteromonas sp. CYL-A6]|uniref:TraR/DksA family transcriptional regulator n=1 Tax=Alteromonas nitratireducens TaxID=3390813 RepID=UPI0034B8A172